MPKFPMHSTAVAAELFQYSQMKKETRISSSEYRALLKAAKEQNRMPQFQKWLKDRKIIITDCVEAPPDAAIIPFNRKW